MFRLGVTPYWLALVLLSLFTISRILGINNKTAKNYSKQGFPAARALPWMSTMGRGPARSRAHQIGESKEKDPPHHAGMWSSR